MTAIERIDRLEKLVESLIGEVDSLREQIIQQTTRITVEADKSAKKFRIIDLDMDRLKSDVSDIERKIDWSKS